MSVTIKLMEGDTLELPDGVGCMSCGKGPDIGITSEGDDPRVLIFCRACAFRIATDLKLTNLHEKLTGYFKVRP